jgi:hypothetical protein
MFILKPPPHLTEKEKKELPSYSSLPLPPSPTIDPTKNKLNNSKLQPVNFGDFSYRSSIYKKLNKNNSVKGIRKVANRKINSSIYDETLAESRIYKELLDLNLADSEKYLMPYEQDNSDNRYAYINFTFQNGSDFISILMKKPLVEKKEQLIILKNAIVALLWFLNSAGRIHGDISLDNLWVDPDLHVRLLDIARSEKVESITKQDALNEFKAFWKNVFINIVHDNTLINQMNKIIQENNIPLTLLNELYSLLLNKVNTLIETTEGGFTMNNIATKGKTRKRKTAKQKQKKSKKSNKTRSKNL